MKISDKEARKRQREQEKRLIDKIIKMLIPIIKDKPFYEIDILFNSVKGAIRTKFYPFKTFGEAISYKKEH